MESDSEFLSDIAYDLFCQSSHLSARSSAIVHQDQSLMLIDTYCTGAMPFVSALLDQPSGRNFHAAIRLGIAWYGGIFGLQGNLELRMRMTVSRIDCRVGVIRSSSKTLAKALYSSEKEGLRRRR